MAPLLLRRHVAIAEIENVRAVPRDGPRGIAENALRVRRGGGCKGHFGERRGEIAREMQ